MTAQTSLRSETRGPGQQQLDAPDAFLALLARLQFPCALRFSSLKKEEEELATTWSSPLFSDSQFTTNVGVQSYYGNNINFINCISLISQEHNYSEIFCLLALAGALVNQFSLLKMILRKRIHTQIDVSVSCFLCSCFSNVLNTPVFVRVVSLTHSNCLLHTRIFQIGGEPLYL